MILRVTWCLHKVLVKDVFFLSPEVAVSWHSSALRILFFISLLAESRLRAPHFCSLNIAIIWKSPWQLSHLSDFPFIFHTGWILLVLGAQGHSIPFSHLLPVVSAILSQVLWERREANKYGRGLLWRYNFCCWQSSKSISVFTWSFPKIQKVLLSCQSCAPRILDELWKPKALQTFPHATAALQGGVGAVPCSSYGQQQGHLVRATGIF